MENKEKTNCKKCNKAGLKLKHWLFVILSFYLLFSCVYGTIKLFKEFF